MVGIMKSRLAECLKGFSKVVLSKPGLPVLGHVRLRTAANMFKAECTDLEQWLCCSFDGAEVSGPLDILVGYADLKAFIGGKGGNTPVSIERTEDGRAKVSLEIGGQTVSRLFDCIDAGEWPESVLPETQQRAVGADLFARIAQAAPSASKDSARRILRSVRLERDAAVATDGMHLVRLNCRVPLDEPVTVPVTKVLASGMLREAGTMGAARSKSGTAYARFASGCWTYTVRCPEGSYPDYRQVIPDDGGMAATVSFTEEDAESLSKALPVFEKAGLDAIVLYAGGKGVKILGAADKSGAVLEIASPCRHKEEHVFQMFDRNFLLRAFSLGLRELSVAGGHAPLTARGECGLMVFMPVRSGSMEPQYKKLGIEKPKEEEANMNEERKTEQSAEAEPETREQPARAAAESPSETGPKLQMQQPADPFEELLGAVEDAKALAKGSLDAVGSLQRKVRDTQRALRQKEREIRSAQEMLDKFRKAANF